MAATAENLATQVEQDPSPELDARNRELAAALALQLAGLAWHTQDYERKALEAFKNDQTEKAYRFLGQAQEAERMIEELNRLRYKLISGEALPALNR